MVVVGLAVGLAALTRGEGVLLVPLMVVPLTLGSRAVRWKLRVRAFLMAVVACLAVLAPWAWRNEAVFSQSVLLSTNSNEVLVYANCDDTYYGDVIGFWQFGCQQQIRDPDGDGVSNFEPSGDEAERSVYWRSVGVAYAREHVGRVPLVVLARIGRQWEVYQPIQNVHLAWIEGRNEDWAWAGLVSFYALALTSVQGVRILRRQIGRAHV